jgi:hypothetical protein
MTAALIRNVAGFLTTALAGCGAMQVDYAANEHKKAAQSVDLGDQKSEVLAILLPTQKVLSASQAKEPERYLQNGKRIEIYYMRSGRQPDGLTTDDEFTPYVFEDDILIAIGWAAIGGAKTQGQVVQPAPVTNVNVEQTVNSF